ncbi:MAG TPA: hypothetical protein VJP83_16640 [Terriglobales bacterium]|nr:hypothetical protein [Terriglobales bacterium]
MEHEDALLQEEKVPEDLRVACRGYAEGVSILERTFEGEQQPCVDFSAECGHTGAVVPLVDILKHAIAFHPQVLEQAYRELGRAPAEKVVDEPHISEYR